MYYYKILKINKHVFFPNYDQSEFQFITHRWSRPKLLSSYKVHTILSEIFYIFFGNSLAFWVEFGLESRLASSETLISSLRLFHSDRKAVKLSKSGETILSFFIPNFSTGDGRHQKDGARRQQGLRWEVSSSLEQVRQRRLEGVVQPNHGTVESLYRCMHPDPGTIILKYLFYHRIKNIF